MAFLYEYMSPDELAYAKEEAQFNNDSMKLDHALECIRMEHAIRISNIDTESLIQEYTQDDLENMYVKEMAIYMEGVKEWWEKFKNWVKSIVNKILGKKSNETPENPEEEVTVPYSPKKLDEVLNKVKGMISNITNIQKDDGSLDTEKVVTGLGLVAGAGGIAAGLKAIYKPVKMKIKDLIAGLNSNGKNLTDVSNSLNNAPSGGEDAEKKCKGIKDLVTPILSTVNGWISNAWAIVTGAKKKNSGEQGSSDSADNSGSSKSENQDTSTSDTKEEPPANDEKKPEEGSKPAEPKQRSSTAQSYADWAAKTKGGPLGSALNFMKKYGRKNKIVENNTYNMTTIEKIVNAAKDDSSVPEDMKKSLDELLKSAETAGVESTLFEYTDDDNDIGESIMESLDDPFNFMESGLEITGGLKELTDLIKDL